MIISRNELRAAVQKAACGGGLNVGLAADVGRAAVWISAHHPALLESALADVLSLEAWGGDGISDAGWDPVQLDESPTAPIAPIAATGPIGLDLLVSSEAPTMVFATTGWKLLAALCGVWASDHQCQFTLNDSTRTATINANGMTEVPVEMMNLVTVACTPDTVAKSASTPESTPDSTPVSGITIDPTTWTELQRLGALTCVPNTEESRAAGAGAGLTDND